MRLRNRSVIVILKTSLLFVMFIFVYQLTQPRELNVPLEGIVLDNKTHSASDFDFLNSLIVSNFTYKSKKEECDDFKVEHDLYPSLYGLESCDTYYLTLLGLRPRKGIVCKSKGPVKFAIFTKISNNQIVECYVQESKFKCFPKSSNFQVCGCNKECAPNSLLSNLPIAEHKPSRKVMSFSVYGLKKDYVCGVLRQIRLQKLFFPDWSSRVYLDSSLGAKYREMIGKEAEVVEIKPDSPLRNSGMFWRFLVAEDKNVDVYCIRDSDSILSHRESIAVGKWLESGKAFNSMRDHLYHTLDIQGGMWCGKNRIENLTERILAWQNRREYGDDQRFLNSVIWPLIHNDTLIFETCRKNGTKALPFPTKRIACEIIGIAYRGGNRRYDSPDYLCF